MATIILQTMPATESSGMVFYSPFASSIELQQCATIAEAQNMAAAMIARAKQAGKGATLTATVFGRKPSGWNQAKHGFALNTFQ